MNDLNPDDDVEMLPEDMTANAIEALHLSVTRLQMHVAGGELDHLSNQELNALMKSAIARDLQKTTVR